MARTFRFVLKSRIAAPVDEVFAWHERPGAFERLVPPWDPVEVVERSGGIDVGARTVIRMKLGPVPTTWVAEHTAYEKNALFRDEQREGPFAKWTHNHRFAAENGATQYEDDVEYALPFGVFGRLFGKGKADEQLAAMFAYRHRIVKTDVERHHAFAGRGPLKVAITGASGFIGKSLVPYLTTAGHTVLPLVRRAAGPNEIAWDPRKGEVESQKLEGVDAVIHLAGASVGEGRWTEERKNEIRQSREQGTRTLSRALSKLTRKPRVLLSGSAIGYYGSPGAQELDESSPPGDDFLATVCKVWEAETRPAEDAGIRTVHLRTGVVLSPAGGALPKMMLPFKFGAGGKLGSGKQFMSWISIEDVIGMLEFLLHRPVRGPVNVVAPHPVTNAEFSKILGHVMSRPSLAPVPGAAISVALGEMGEWTALASQRVKPVVATREGFSFLYPELEPALRMLLGKERA